MKSLETAMLLYQYLYYTMRRWDVQLRLPASITQGRAIAVLMGLELFLFITVCLIVHHIISGHTFVGSDLPDLRDPVFITEFIAFFSVLYFINNRLLGSDRRMQHYEKIFEAWDKWKRRRWSFYTWGIMGVVFAVLWIVMEADENRIYPRNWIDDLAGTVWSDLTKER